MARDLVDYTWRILDLIANMFFVAKNDCNKNEDDRQPLDQMRLIAMDDRDEMPLHESSSPSVSRLIDDRWSKFDRIACVKKDFI